MNADLTDPAFHNEDAARARLEAVPWPSGPYCAHCGSFNVVRMKGKAHRPGVLNCRDCRRHFLCYGRTVFERRPYSPDKWLLANHLKTRHDGPPGGGRPHSQMHAFAHSGPLRRDPRHRKGTCIRWRPVRWRRSCETDEGTLLLIPGVRVIHLPQQIDPFSCMGQSFLLFGWRTYDTGARTSGFGGMIGAARP